MIFFKYILVGFLWLLSLLPFPLLYGFSYFVSALTFNVFRYRRQVVIRNFRNAFPSMSEKEIYLHSRKFYRNLADLFIEIIKLNTISRKQLLCRLKFSNIELLDRYYDSGRSVLISIGHCGNWEWMAMSLALQSRYKVFAVVKPLTDKFFDRYLDGLRQKFNKDSLIHYKQTYRILIKNKNIRTATIIASDQTPARGDSDFWIQFLNQETLVFTGIGRISKGLDIPVLFFDLQREKRGRYLVHIEELVADPKKKSEEQIIIKAGKSIEDAIIRHPDNWLWSHRRWKHKRE